MAQKPISPNGTQHSGDVLQPSPRPALLLSSGLGLLAALLYVLLRQDTTHQFDIYWMLPRLRDGLTHYPRHPLAFPLLDGLVTMLDGWGSLHERFKMANGICTGIAVAIFAHTAQGLCQNRRHALLVTITFAMLPATVRFATLAELHGLFLPFAALVIWQTSRMVSQQRVTVWSSMVLGLLTAIAAGVHGTGHLLVGVAGLWLLLSQWRYEPAQLTPLRQLATALLALVTVHALATTLLTVCITAPTDAQWQVVTKEVHTTDGMLATLAGELLWPLFPVSLLWPIALFCKPRVLALVFALSLPAYLATCQLLLCVPKLGYTFHEDGAYLEPIAFLAVVIAFRVVRGPWQLLLPALALTASICWHHYPERQAPDRAFGSTATSFLATHDVRLLVGGFAEYDGSVEALTEDPVKDALRANLMLAEQLILEVRVRDTVDADQLALYFHPAAAGKPTVLTDNALATLRAAGEVFTTCVDVVMPRLYELQPVRYVGSSGATLTGVQLKPRQ